MRFSGLVNYYDPQDPGRLQRWALPQSLLPERFPRLLDLNHIPDWLARRLCWARGLEAGSCSISIGRRQATNCFVLYAEAQMREGSKVHHVSRRNYRRVFPAASRPC
ncbi:hypothetical protein [Pseudomonas aeruginosa]|uniref:hypothetical protein n=1 Tax=Pseudomonas aeruginosa TaxID=287 RepID=UPI0034D28142